MKFIPISQPILAGNEAKYVRECLKSGWISSQGEFVRRFEKAFSDYCGVKYAITNSSGTAALHLALLTLKIGPGDEVIVPDLTFISPINMVIQTGARPVFVDVDKNNWNIDVNEIESVITEKTKAIIAVHLYGHPCQMDRILALAKKYNLFVIEDCAEAHGAEYKGKRVGSFGDISCFSFFGNKIITTGEGGICLTDNKRLAERMRILANHGDSPKKKYWHNQVAFNYRLTNLQAAVGLAQLEQIDKFLKKRDKIGKIYSKYLGNINSLTLLPREEWAKPVCWLYSILIDPRKHKISRDRLIEELRRKNIDSRPFFYPVHQMPPYKKYIKRGQTFKTTEYLSARGLSLPSSIDLTNNQINYIVRAIKTELNNA